MYTNNKDFYPTPQSLIDKMLEGVDFHFVHSILEPSAGSGNIVDALRARQKASFYNKVEYDIDCIEKDPEMQHILKGKGFRVVYNDFLTYESMKEYDLILMNPPFSQGAAHLLKALDLQERNGGAVVCLLNAETLKNLCCVERKVLSHKLEHYNADIRYLENPFHDAERQTDVEVALIKVKLPDIKRESRIIQDLQKAEDQKEIESEDMHQLTENDLFKSIVEQYKMEAKAGISLIKEFFAMQPYIYTSFLRNKNTGEVETGGGCILSLDFNTYQKDPVTINGFLQELRKKYWTALFENPNFIGKLTNDLRRAYYNKLEELKNYDFSLYNIYQLQLEMTTQVGQGIEDAIISLFDELSYKHYYDEMSKNVHYYNGWKTNKSYIVNKKVILPLSGYRDLCYSWGGFKPTNRDVISKLEDLEKCFSYLAGFVSDAESVAQIMSVAEQSETTKNIQCKYFNVTFFKKGTCHIVFTNEELLKKFNIFGSQKKGWLPPNYGNVKYEDMTKEEQSVIDQFEGKSSYENVIQNRDTYFGSISSLELLEKCS